LAQHWQVVSQAAPASWQQTLVAPHALAANPVAQTLAFRQHPLSSLHSPAGPEHR
jgi:hypothetical protein